MDLGLKDNVIIVTGGASGIGQAITRQCLVEGAKVIVVSRISEGVEEFIAEMQAGGRPCELHIAELDNSEHCRAAIAHVGKKYGSLYGLVNNAGVNDGVGLENGDPDRFMQSIRVNLLHCYALAHYALPMLKRSQGAIVNIGSKVAVTGQGNTSGYAAAKGGVLGLTREWAAELLPHNIRVNAVMPAEVMTPNYRQWLATLADPAAKLAHITEQIPLGHRMTKPEEIASMAVLLLSPTHSGLTTGQQLNVDGGYVHLDRMLTANPLY